MLRIRVLGEPAFEGEDGPIELTGSWRALSLFSWLALNPGTHPRGTIAPLFWPDVLDSSARASLRNALWAIRKALGPDAEALVASRDRVGIAEGLVWVDALAFQEHIREGRLTEALDLVRGEPLTGLDDDWAYEYRDEHRDQLSDLLERLALEADGVPDPRAATEWSRRRVALDPLDESAQRALIARLIATGDRSGALSAYGRFRQQLRTELGISPSEETRDLVLELREAEPEEVAPQEPPDEAPGVSTPGWTPGEGFEPPARLRGRIQSALVGRAREMEELRGVWAGVESGKGARLARLTGESGIGKSRLAREIALEASAGGAIVLFGAADGELVVPHQIWAEAIGQLVSALGADDVQRRLGPGSADLEPIAPLAASGMSGAVDREHDAGEGRRYRLLEGVGALLESVTADAPVLLVADDIHWADDSTAAILRHALESRPGIRLLVVATQRSEIEPVEGLAQAISRLAREGLALEIPVEGLHEGDVAELSQVLSEHELTDELLSTIARETGGNPFFVGELVRYLGESGADPRVLSLTHADVPERVREVVDLRLRRLSEPAIRLLSVAAVVGNEFELGLLEAVGSARDEELLALLEEGISAQLVSEADYGDDDTFVFSHVLVRRTLMARLARASRRRIHARIAEALERSRGEAALLQIAHHMCEARGAADRERALDYAVRAAQQAMGSLAYAEAVDLFTRARSLLPDEDPRRRMLALKRAVAYQALFHAVYDASAGDTHAEPA